MQKKQQILKKCKKSVAFYKNRVYIINCASEKKTSKKCQ